MVLTLTSCKSNHVYDLGNFDVDYKTIELNEKYDLGKKFTISFWIETKSAYVGTNILTIRNKNDEVSLLNTTEDDEGQLTGLVLINKNGMLCLNNDYYLKLNTKNHVVIELNKKYFSLYLNGEKIGEQAFSKSFSGKDLSFILGSDKLSAKITDLKLCDYINTEELVNIDDDSFKYNLTFDDAFLNNAKGKIKLPEVNGLTYRIGNDDVAELDGYYLTFYDNDTNKDKELILTATYQGVDKEYRFNIRGNNKEKLLLNTKILVYNSLNYIISESDIFDTNINGIDVEYEVIGGNASFVNNHFLKNELANEKEKITVRVNIDDISFQKDIVLLDEYYAYLLAGFTGQAIFPECIEGNEKSFFALSEDLKKWSYIDSISINVSSGSKRVRDQYLSRDKTGNYLLLGTQGYMHPEIYLANSESINEFELELKNINYSDKDLHIFANYSWAPEIIYDYDNDQYLILYSDTETKNSPIYAVATKDFELFSYPFIFFDVGFTIIDANITMFDGKYYLFYKGEDVERYGALYYAVSDSLSCGSNWRLYDDEITSSYNLEGPFGLKGLDNKNYLFADAFEVAKPYYGLFDSDSKINLKNIKDLNGVHHFSILKITKSEYERLMEE
ncbi:MAG: LamG-like jellyroll fold domain-containing protein [Erysipelotrichaceae bacterium]|nr:LamG-like jellyroll fold domain-containing protein [Erysipelotrichaceae bacterium]